MSMTELDAPDGSGLRIIADLKASLDFFGHQAKRQADIAEKQLRLVQQAGLLQPISRNQSDARTCGSTGILVLDLGGPAQGRLWDVRRLVVGGLTVATAAAGTADVYVSAAGVSQQPGSLLDWCDTASSLPLMATYGATELGLRYPEHLFVVIRGGTNAQMYMAAARIVDHIETPVSQVSEGVGA